MKHFKSYELSYRLPSVISLPFLPTISTSLNICQLKEVNTFSHKAINRYIQLSVWIMLSVDVYSYSNLQEAER